MEEERESERERERLEIEETTPLLDSSTVATSTSSNEVEAEGEGSPSSSKPNRRSVKAKVPEAEVHLFRRGKGPVAVFKSALGGWDQDQLEVRDILEQYGLKCIYAFNPRSGRTFPIRFHSRNGRSVLPYKDRSVIYIDGEPKDKYQSLRIVNPDSETQEEEPGVDDALFLQANDGWNKKERVFGLGSVAEVFYDRPTSNSCQSIGSSSKALKVHQLEQQINQMDNEKKQMQARIDEQSQQLNEMRRQLFETQQIMQEQNQRLMALQNLMEKVMHQYSEFSSDQSSKPPSSSSGPPLT